MSNIDKYVYINATKPGNLSEKTVFPHATNLM